MQRLLWIVLILLPLGALAAAPVSRPSARVQTVPNQLVVKFAPSATPAYRNALHSLAGARVVSTIPQLGIHTIQLPNAASAQAYRKRPGVLWAEPNRLRRALLAAPNDPAYNDLDENLGFDPDLATWYEWDARDMQSLEGWDTWPGRYYTATGKGADAVRIAVIDSGIDYTHPDFRNAGATSSSVADGGQLERPLDRTIVNGTFTADAWDAHGHGTHVAGIAAAATNNGIGVSGTGYNADIMSLRILDAAGNGTEADIAHAIVYAADNGALIVNASVGGYGYSQAEQEAVDYAWSKGTLVIAAAGNDGTHLSPNYPAALNRVLAVSATAREERLAQYSNYGEYVGVAAPGGDFDFIINWFLGIYSTMPTYPVTLTGPDYGAQNNYDYLQGTSMASPQVAGLAALYAGQQGFTQSTPDVTVKIWQAIQRGAEDISGGAGDWNLYYGHGRINVYNTLNLHTEPNPRGATTGCITGQVRYKGTPVSLATVRVTLGNGSTVVATSRPDGGFRLAGLPPGTYTATATVFGESAVLGALPVTAGCDYPGVGFNIGGGDEPPLTPPAAPAGVSVAPVNASQLLVSWQDKSINEAGFEVERMPAGGSYSAAGTSGRDSTLFLDSGLSPNTVYNYRVRAYNAAGMSTWANGGTGRTHPTPPLPPSNLQVQALSQTQVRLTWTDGSPDEDGFKIERRDGTTFIQTAIANPNATGYTDAGLSPNTIYTYRTRAFNAGGDSPYTAQGSARTLPTPPTAPGALKAVTLSSTSIRLYWADNSANEKGFEIERQRATNSFLPAATVAANVRTYTDAGLVANVQYTYRIRAYNDGGRSDWSAEATTSTFPPPPAAPSHLTAVALSASVMTLTWRDRSTNETEFVIERNTNGTGFTKVGTAPANATGHFDAGLAANATYVYRVCAANTGGKSAYSNEAGGSAGAGGAGTLSVRPRKVTFSGVRPGTTVSRMVLFRNVGRGRLKVRLGELFAPFSVDEAHRAFRLRPGRSRRVRVSYTAPVGAAAASDPAATLLVASSDARQPLVRVRVSVGR